MTGRRSGEGSSCGLEFNKCNIHLYLRLNYGTVPEHLKYSVQTLYGALWCFCGVPWGLTTTQNIISLKAQDRIWIGSGLTDTRSAENDWIGADTDPAYRIDASLVRRQGQTKVWEWNQQGGRPMQAGRTNQQGPNIQNHSISRVQPGQYLDGRSSWEN